MIVIGLTGSIGTGKSTVTKQFASLGAATLDSDAVVHALLAKGGEAVQKVAALFPESLHGDAIDRKKLSTIVFADAAKLKQLEAILHRMVRERQERFIRQARRRGKRIVVLDIPLLFETQGQKRCDVTVVTTAPLFLMRQRVMKRAHMTEEKFARILKAQIPDHEKRRRGNFIVHTGLGKAESLKQARRILLQVKPKNAFLAS